jgi:hypothetical protein
MVPHDARTTRKPMISARKASASEIRAAFDIKPSHVKVAEEALRAVLAPRKPARGGSSATKKTPNGVRAAASRRQPA